jgi:hypothetical protein
MKKGIILLAMVAVLVFLQPASTARADELSDLKQQVESQNKTLSQLQRRIAGLEAEGKEGAGLPDSIKWIENVKISGDFRYRHEHLDQEDVTAGRAGWANSVDRHRIRARLMLQAIINDEWDVAFRLATGSDASPISTNQDLEDSFDKKDVWLDLAYFTWHPAAHEDLTVFGGKMKNAFYRAGKNQLIWDSDLNPEGIAAQHVTLLNGTDQLLLTGGGFWADEDGTSAGSGVDTSLWGVQAYWKRTIGNPDYVLAGASYYDFANIEGRGNLSGTWGSSTSFFGNTNSGLGGAYLRDYDMLEAFGEYGFECPRTGMPIAVFTSWVQNLAANPGDDIGWLVGGKLNKAKDPGSWELSWDYRELDADAVVGGLTESDFLGGGTDSRGHKFGFKYQMAKNLQAGVTYYHLEDDIAGSTSSSRDLNYRRLQTDLIFKF